MWAWVFNSFRSAATRFECSRSPSVWGRIANYIVPELRIGPVPWSLACEIRREATALEYQTGYFAFVLVQAQGLGDGYFGAEVDILDGDRKSTRLNSSHSQISYAV